MRIFRKIKIADLFTFGNGITGFLAMLSFREGGWGQRMVSEELFFLPGIILIVLGMVLDGIDGEVARWEKKKFGVKNRIGHYLDSISDTITFCLAPAYLLYTVYAYPWKGLSAAEWTVNILIVTAAVMVALFGVLRLARFVSSQHKLDLFFGLPTPANAFIICVLSFLFHPKPGTAESSYWFITIPIAIVMSFLMISDYKYPKIFGRVRIIFGGLIFFFVTSLTLRVFNIKVWKNLTDAEVFGLNLFAVMALGVALFYAFGMPIIMELKLEKRKVRTVRGKS